MKNWQKQFEEDLTQIFSDELQDYREELIKILEQKTGLEWTINDDGDIVPISQDNLEAGLQEFGSAQLHREPKPYIQKTIREAKKRIGYDV